MRIANRWALALVVCLAMPCVAQKRQFTNGADENFPADAMDRKVPRLQLDGVPFRDAIERLAEQSHTNILVDWNSLEKAKVAADTPVKYNASNVTVLVALGKIMELTSRDLMMNPTHGTLLVTTKEGFKTPRGWMGLIHAPAAGAKEDSEVLARLRKNVPQAKFDGVKFKEAIEFLADPKRLAVSFDVDWAALKNAGVDPEQPVTFVLKNVRGSDVLYWVVHSVDAKEPIAYVIEHGKVKLSTKQNVEK